jgi:SAM-dependent methyltransferase
MTSESVKRHYDQHLGAVYQWMLGGEIAALNAARTDLLAAGVTEKGSGQVVDLGAGLGYHAQTLAQWGYSVTAVDGCEQFVADLRKRTEGLPVRAVHGDVLDYQNHVTGPTGLFLCMGDTLTHLPSASDVELLFKKIAENLINGGLFIATFRDYVSQVPPGNKNFILVRGDDSRILTCFLDYQDATVTVYDVLHEKENTAWRLKVGHYAKLRLAPDWVTGKLHSFGFVVDKQALPSGMIRIVARLER